MCATFLIANFNISTNKFGYNADEIKFLAAIIIALMLVAIIEKHFIKFYIYKMLFI